MAEYVCSFTNQSTSNPVVSTVSGHIFDKDAIESYLEKESYCPITNKPLTKENLVPLQMAQPSKTKQNEDKGISNSILLFQQEWDSVILESYVLKQNLETVRKELSHTLYQYDAACRTIARLIKEKDEAKNALNNINAYKNQNRHAKVFTAGSGAKEFPEKMIRDIYDLRIDLSKMRRELERDSQAQLAYGTQEMMLNYKLNNSSVIPSDQNSGLSCLDINTDLDDLILIGGNDGGVSLYNRAREKVLSKFSKHTKPVTGVKFALGRSKGGRQAVGISSSEDGIGYAFTHNYDNGQIADYYKYANHKGELTGCAVHPINYLGIFSSTDGSFSCHDLTQGALLSHVPLGNVPITAMGIHPDGEIAAFAGEDGSISIWNVPQLVQIGKIKAHDAPINSLSLSEDGKFLVTSSFQEKMIKLWELRKLGDDTYRILSDELEGVVGFDRSGKYLGVGAGQSLHLYNVRTMDMFTKISAHQDRVTGVQFGNYSKYFATVSLDGHLNIFS